ncbi:MAG: Asp-tRNA(Asn)/Glu-tRNA(Gln) amidotransferase subunit GatC [Fusobacteria bacterium]|nr:Asp-tRNA(Asn)/Glu-tRNA(Gln) amidotransferase subunit GatC [Fusobacteriota bacterium]
MIENKTVEKLAQLSQLEFNASEINEIILDLNSIVQFVDNLQAIPTAELEKIQLDRVSSDFKNDFNEDTPHVSLSISEAVKNSKTHSDGEFIVTKVL